jgi:hypothetical protein
MQGGCVIQQIAGVTSHGLNKNGVVGTAVAIIPLPVALIPSTIASIPLPVTLHFELINVGAERLTFRLPVSSVKDNSTFQLTARTAVMEDLFNG